MIAKYVVDLQLPISQNRLERYRPKDAFGNHIGSDMEMLVGYFWNMALAESLYPCLHGVEIALRNAIHATLTNRYQSEEWWRRQSVRMFPSQLKTISDIEEDHRRRHQIPITPGRLISELNFGFWTTLLSQPYESRIWRYKHFVLLSQVFPTLANRPCPTSTNGSTTSASCATG